MEIKEKTNLQLISFYRFVEIENKNRIKFILDNFLKKRFVRGTILISEEGINGSLTGTSQNIMKCIAFIKNKLKIRKLHFNVNDVNFMPFNRMKVRLKKEIISMGEGKIKTKEFSNNHLSPKNWDKFLSNKKVKLIDARNEYEIRIGKFKNAINPHTKSFRDFPKKLNELKLEKLDEIGIYCTGGIRCEKAAEYMRLKGFKNVYQLDGGILNYINYKKKDKARSKWSGECFVFDNRVTVNKNLKPGKYLQCYGCRMPITRIDTKSNKYVKGVSCPYCFNTRTEKQKKNSLVRQKQIEFSEEKGLAHPFKKIKSVDIN
tara:strand:+ start:2431 stop:3381 length:951 start_codon:yes stop_codon:yes gene_type:complete